jgi:hypothetical protein
MRAIGRNRYIAVVLLILAPLAQTLAIGIWKSFPASFALYTILVCLGSTILIGAVLWKKQSKASPFLMLGLIPVKKSLLVLGLLLGITIDAIMILGFWVFFDAFSDAGAVVAVAQRLGIRGGAYLWIAIAGLVVNSIAEELFWRGSPHALLGLIPDVGQQKLFSPLQSGAIGRTMLVSVFFGINHIGIMATLAPSIPAALLSLLGIFLSGLLWGFLRESTKSLIPSLVSHVLVTLGYSGLLVFYFSRV